ncbi:hypothetical protein M409DRAFT_16198 [Zasmidium cellare ATCC 36951]|uniref:S-adenosyl-L-methionine-dependent N-methyltransferase n=1 Tax=Zasmidium cellare ATCC 36951 TaxID=1080233 RepID=A0A6A6D6H1_ZASCE|nr:uncharacterized protein M409DRAFT_16198 [Zasmidium cellare ATCC 36951]KAF2173930.1 hypothetical protein M409DRAFT_16198 [Zasmidium cellare ATCC 36951]
MSNPSLIVFGSQTTWPTEDQSALVRKCLLLEKSLFPLVQAIRDLPSLWKALEETDPTLKNVPGPQAAAAFKTWLDQGILSRPSESTSLPNAFATPLTVIVHICLYCQYLQDNDDVSHEGLQESLKQGGVQGFCTGLLSAIVVASAKSREDIGKLAATALSLAFCIGCYVDADGQEDETNSGYSCLVARWRSTGERDACEKIVESFPQAYTSVIYDHNNVTVTIPQSKEAELLSKLSEGGIMSRKIELQGRFHSHALIKKAEKLRALVKRDSQLQLPNADALILPVRTNCDGRIIYEGSTSLIAIRSLLLELADWHQTITAASASLSDDEPKHILSIGLSEAVPTSVSRQPDITVSRLDAAGSAEKTSYCRPTEGISADAIAIVGMSAKYAGADSIHDFWDVVKEGRSMVETLPNSRWPRTGLRRTADGASWWGNFVHDVDMFDHKFFKKSSREAAAMDPQQRLLLQAAYQAVEGTGYFGAPVQIEDVGCYVGVATQDYHDSIAAHKPSAFSALGELRAFLSGRLSYHFGWTGPSMTFDTACSASMIAIDAACKAIQDGHVTAALAGGVNVFSSPYLWENLRAANFLSPTGATKPFDAKADGYCRGEGVGLIFLKKLTTAIADGDHVLSVIGGTSVNQCKNETYITVPHGPSQTNLYKGLLEQTRVKPEEISFVEAHGTGTQAGDPVEISSIRNVLQVPQRRETLHVGSVKGNVGHCEAASGVASVMKAVMMIQNGIIPPLASHTSLNPKIPALEASKMAIPMCCMPWKTGFKAVLVNNYGAAGSNGAAVIYQPPNTGSSLNTGHSLNKVPFLISAYSENSLKAYCNVLRNYVSKLASADSSHNQLADLAFNIADKRKVFTENAFATTASTLPELASTLASVSGNCAAKPKPVVLTFGGQTKSFVGLDKKLYQDVPLFRRHLDEANSVMREQGLDGIYPALFQTEPVEDVVTLHCLFFAVQYASAKTWMASGINVDGIIGHSFGQLTGLCVSGVLSIQDAVKVVAGRAELMQKHWGPERGSMLSLMADGDTTTKVLKALEGEGHRAEVACYNGPTSHVLVGSKSAIDAAEEILKTQTENLGNVRSRRLQVTHGFHSEFTEPLLPGLLEVAKGLTFNKPTIPIETCSSGSAWDIATPERIVEHTRTAVYFGEAVQRLGERLGACTWLEAGGDSGVTSMVKVVFGKENAGAHTFQPIQMTGEAAMDGLADSTAALWKVGHKFRFWAFDRPQRRKFAKLSLPPYQFEKTSHWLSWEEPSAAASVAPIVQGVDKYELLKMSEKGNNESNFAIDPRSEEFKAFVQGHAVLDSPLCPADLYLEIVNRAALELIPSKQEVLVPSVDDLSMVAPLGTDPKRTVNLSMSKLGSSQRAWRFQFTSKDSNGKQTTHASGEFRLTPPDDRHLKHEITRYERLIDVNRAKGFLQAKDSTGLQGNLVYRLFSRVVNYAEEYRGIKSVSSMRGETAAEVYLPANPLTHDCLLDPIAVDNYLQVAGIKTNLLEDCPPNQVYICGQIGRIQATEDFRYRDTKADVHSVVYAQTRVTGPKDTLSDIFVFSNTGKLQVIIFGVQFTGIPIASLSRAIGAVNESNPNAKAKDAPAEKTDKKARPQVPSTEDVSKGLAKKSKPKSDSGSSATGSTASEDAFPQLAKVLSSITDVPAAEIQRGASLDDLGIDSLMTAELISTIKDQMNVELSSAELLDASNAGAISQLLTPSASGSNTTAGSSADSGTSTPSPYASDASTSITAPSEASDGDAGKDKKDGLSDLAKLVAEYTETNDALLPETDLEDLGLDSLLSVEMAQAISKRFGTEISSKDFLGGSFGDLCKLVINEKSGGQQETASSEGAEQPAPCHAKVEHPVVSAPEFRDAGPTERRKVGDRMKTICFKEVDGVELLADVYLPDPSEVTERKRPIALMIHGGGHTMLSRKDIRPRQTQLLLKNGYLPVSIDYRLCPEINIIDGPMTDVLDALQWVREVLPTMDLERPDLQLDASKVFAIGWSTGGTLTLSLGFTSRKRGVEPPTASLAFYCPSNYEDKFWQEPNFPENSKDAFPSTYDLLEGVQEKPITAYNVPPSTGSAVGGWCNMEDPRSRIVLHMNCKGQALPILLGGLPPKSKADKAVGEYLDLPQPDVEKLVSISPWSQIMRGNYTTPTYLIHSTTDDLVPLEQMEATHEALRSKGIPTGLSVVEDVPHLFDLYRDKPDKRCWKAVVEGYRFLHQYA